MWHNNDGLIQTYNRFIENKEVFPCECPECKNQSVHIYVHSHENNHCGVWVWCSKCCAFSHMSAQTPSWWKNPVFIDENELCSEPDYLEENSDEIDEWVNSFKSCKRSKMQQNVIEDCFNVRLKTDIQGIPSGAEGTIVIKNDFKTVTVQFISKDGEITEILLNHVELIKSVEIL